MALDFLILYEHIVREYESITLLKCELERRGYTAEIRQLLDRKKLKYFTWKNSDELNIGTGAQSLCNIYPELVTEVDGKLRVDYSKLSVIALAAIDKLYEENLELKSRMDKLEKLILNGR